MKNQKLVMTCLLLSGLLSLLLAACSTISTSGNYTLESGQTLRGNLVVTSGNAWLEEDSRVTGSVLMTSGNLTVEGEVGDDIIMFSGSTSLAPSAVVHGDIRSTSGNVQQAEGSLVEGSVSTEQSTIRIGSAFFASLFGIVCLLPLVLLGGLIVVAVWLGRRRPSRVEATPQGGDGKTQAAESTPTQKLQQLKEMLDQGLITETEYEAKKSEILGKF